MQQLNIPLKRRRDYPYRSLIAAVLQRAVYDAQEGIPGYVRGEGDRPPENHLEDLKAWAEDCPGLSRAQIAQIVKEQ